MACFMVTKRLADCACRVRRAPGTGLWKASMKLSSRTQVKGLDEDSARWGVSIQVRLFSRDDQHSP